MIIQDLPAEKYHKLPEISKSDLDQFAKSPAHYLAYKQGKRTISSKSLIDGSAFHSLVLEPESFDKFYIQAPKCDRRTTDGKKIWNDFLEKANGRTVVDYEMNYMLNGMAASVRNHKIARNLMLDASIRELTVITENEGVAVRSRLDMITVDGDIVDFKSTLDASPDAFARSIGQYRYHVQNAFYSDNARLGGLDTSGDFYFVAVEKEPPFAVAVYDLDTVSVSHGRRIYKSQLETVSTCLEYQTFPGYSERFQTLSLKDWEFKKPID